jgi:hypothetical protein
VWGQELPPDWLAIHHSDTPITESSLLTGFNTESLEEGIHTFRLRVTDSFDQTNTVKQTVEVSNVEISSPKNNDVLRAGDIIPIVGSVFGKSRTYQVGVWIRHFALRMVFRKLRIKSRNWNLPVPGHIGHLGHKHSSHPICFTP